MSINNEGRSKKNLIYHNHEIEHNQVESLAKIFQEFKTGFDFLKKYSRSVTFFGSARFTPENIYFQKAEELAGRIVHELKYAIITGGGPGIMSAGNKGAYQAGGTSLGVNIQLPHEQSINQYVSDSRSFHYFFTRKTMLTFAAEAYVVFPGGFGTLDELFGVLTLIQTKKIPPVPVFLYGSEFWKPLESFIKTTLLANDTIDATDVNLFTVTDDLDFIMNGIKQAPVSRWWKDIEN